MSRRGFPATIRTRLIIAFMTVITLPVAGLSIYSGHTHLRALEALAFDGSIDQARYHASRLANTLSSAQRDLLYLSQLPSLDAYVEAVRDGRRGDVAYAREKLRRQCQSFAASRGQYQAVVYLDSTGSEQVRVEHPGDTKSAGDSASRPAAGSYREVLAEADRLLAGQSLTHVDVRGSTAVLQFVSRLFPRDLQRRGYVLLEVSSSELAGAEAETGRRIVVRDPAGRIVVGGAEAIEPETWTELVRQAGRPLETSGGRILTYVPVRPNPADPAEVWGVVSIEPRAIVFGALNRYRWVFTLVLAAALALAGAMNVLLARQFTRPLQRLYAAAQGIGRGQFDVDLEDHTGDEIGGLARELRAMADQLEIKQDDMQQALDEKTRELLRAERLSTIGTMSAAIGHEVNNPLGIISMYSQMLLERLDENDPRAAKLEAIAREASRMSGLVRGLLQFARRPPLAVQRVDPARLIDEAVAAVRDLHERADRIEVQHEVAAGCSAIEADPDQLGQVLRNLLMNALDATDAGGWVRIKAEADGPRHVAITVADNGQGIDPEHVTELFEPFFSTRRFGAGTGLGLAVCKDIVECHKGVISVASELNRGTTFTVRLPVRGAIDEAATTTDEDTERT